jgi:hypothetical protein
MRPWPTHDSLRDHVCTRADLQAVSDEVTQLGGMLDGLNRHRFLRDLERPAVWEGTRHVVTAPQLSWRRCRRKGWWGR